MFEFVKVDSSAISQVAYDKASGVLKVQFTSGGTYDYYDVPEDKYEGLLTAPSVGKYFHANIRQYSANKR